MPIIPSQTGSGGHIQSPGENRGFLIDVIDHTAGTVYDVILDFIFGFENVPENWTRKMRVFANRSGISKMLQICHAAREHFMITGDIFSFCLIVTKKYDHRKDVKKV